MKSLLPYFVVFSNDGSMIPKISPKNCIVGNSDQTPIIMIIHDKNIFSANDGRQKV